jgi:serine protease Do
VKQVSPAVVSIESKVNQRNGRDAVIGPARQGADLGFGSGFVVDPKGVIITCYHVVAGADWVEVSLPDGRKLMSRDIRGDRKTDLAVIRVQPAKPLPFLEMADSDTMEVGDRVLAVGAPFGLTGSVTHGIVSAKSRNLRLNQYEDFLQTDAAINPGNSGGPLINMDGRVVGVNSAIKSRSGGFQGVGLAISSNLAQSIKEELLKNGTVRRGYLGVGVRDVKELGADELKRLGLNGDAGVIVTRVFPKTPAEKGGLENGDIVLSIGGKVIHDGDALQKVVSTLPIDQPVVVDLIRGSERKVLKMTIEEQPETFGLGPARSDE